MSAENETDLLERNIRTCVEWYMRMYTKSRSPLRAILEHVESTIRNSEELMREVHSVRSRIKDPEHLAGKLRRKPPRCLSDPEYPRDPQRILDEVTDLIGIRLLHINSLQLERILPRLVAALSDLGFIPVGEPFARTWDDESRSNFDNLKVRWEPSRTLYTSVHYTVKPNRAFPCCCEIQIRTLAEELWGEVDHEFRYPNPSPHLPVTEQILALARLTSSCSRLVDSIYRTHECLSQRDASDPPAISDSSPSGTLPTSE